MISFRRYELRSTDPVAAAAFYAQVIGLTPASAGLGISALPEQARARGAPSHWLGLLGVSDLEAEVERLLPRGFLRLGPPFVAGGGPSTSLRDPFGAVIGLTTAAGEAKAVAWRDLHSKDRPGAAALYASCFGWPLLPTIDLGRYGAYDPFSLGGEPAGGFMDSGLPGLHPHWLYAFEVQELSGALARVQSLGGSLLSAPERGPGGRQVAGCEDPQGAVFALLERLTPPASG